MTETQNILTSSPFDKLKWVKEYIMTTEDLGTLVFGIVFLIILYYFGKMVLHLVINFIWPLTIILLAIFSLPPMRKLKFEEVAEKCIYLFGKLLTMFLVSFPNL